jgi:hypothetical protein
LWPIRSNSASTSAAHVPVWQRSEIELHAGPVAPVQRNLVDGGSGLAAIHGRRVVPGRIEMRAIVGRERDAFDRPALAVRQVFALQAGEEFLQHRDRLTVSQVLDRWFETRRVRGHVVLERDREIDDPRAHERPLRCGYRRARIGAS